jgi:5-methylcytosine-specific restriction endonuclease McrA
MRRFGFSQQAWRDAVKRGAIVPRDRLIPLEELLVVGRRTGRGHLKRRLVQAGLKRERCEECGLEQWRGRALGLQLHHINGNKVDNRLENLKILCPNCHAQTNTWGGRNGHRKPERHLRLVELAEDEGAVESA